MKYLALALVLALGALTPYLCGKMSVNAVETRFRNACDDLSINARPFYVEQGYLSSSLFLEEPLSTTVSSMGLPPEAVDFFRAYNFSLKVDVAHGPKGFLKGAEHTVLTLRGPDWKFTGEEWRTNKFFGPTQRTVRLYDTDLNCEGVSFCSSNFWMRDDGTISETTASRLALLPGFEVSGLKYVSVDVDGRRTGTLSASFLRLGNEAVSGLVVKVESVPLIKGGTDSDLKFEIQKGEGLGTNLIGKTASFGKKEQFIKALIGFFKDEQGADRLLEGGSDD